MSDEKTSDMNKNIIKRVRVYILFFAFVILGQIWGSALWSLVSSSMAPDPDTSAWAQKIIESIFTVMGLGAFLVVNFARDINLHNLIDKCVFDVRRITDDIIQQKMIEKVQKIDVSCCENMKGRKSDVRDFFYHFVNDQEVLRSLAFTYWEQYFVNISIIFFGALSFLISSIISIVRWKFDIYTFTPSFFAFIALVLFLSTKYSLVPKIYGLPSKQIEEFCNTQAEEFKKQLELRFSRTILRAGGQ